MTDRARVSVCMAAHNGERYIKDQLKSILVQLCSTDEIIVVDDASRDTTVEIVHDMRDPRILVIRNERNGGVLAAFERAIREASGQLIFLSDQDDLWAPNKVIEFLNAFKAHPEAMVVISDAAIINGRAEVVAQSNFPRWPFRPGLFANLLHSRFIGCQMAFRSALLPCVLPFPHGLDVLHDIWIGTSNSAIGGVTWYIDMPLTKYRRHGGNATGVTKLPFRRQMRLRVHLIYALIQSWMRRRRMANSAFASKRSQG